MCGFSIVRCAPLRYCDGASRPGLGGYHERALAYQERVRRPDRAEPRVSQQFAFVHGMSHGAWCWAAVQARLEGPAQAPAPVEHARGMSGLPPGDARVVEALARLTPQPFRPCAERVDMRRFYAMAVPRTR